MLLLIPALLALAAALLRGGSLAYLATLPLRRAGLIMCSLAAQVAIYTPALQRSPLVARWGGELYLAALALALIGVLSNWRLGPAVRLVAAGVALNLLVIAANGGYMPVSARAMRAAQGERTVRALTDRALYSNTRLAGSAAHLGALSDIIPVRLPGGPGNVYSVGDLLLASGVALLVYRATRSPWPDYGRPEPAHTSPRA